MCRSRQQTGALLPLMQWCSLNVTKLLKKCFWQLRWEPESRLAIWIAGKNWIHLCLSYFRGIPEQPLEDAQWCEKRRNYYLRFLPFIYFLLFLLFFPSRATENYFYMHHLISLKFTPWYIFIKKNSKKTLYWTKLTGFLIDLFSLFVETLYWNTIFFPTQILKSCIETSSRKELFSWNEMRLLECMVNL